MKEARIAELKIKKIVEDGVLETVLKNFGKTIESIEDDVTAVKEWMRSQPYFPEIMHDHCIRNFLLLNKCKIEKTKQKIDKYYSMRTTMPDIFGQINPKLPNLRDCFDAVYAVALPQLTKDGNRVFVVKIRDVELVDRSDVLDAIRFSVNMQEMRLREDILYSDIFILDAVGVSMKWLCKLTPTLILKVLSIYQGVFSLRLKAAYVLNCPSWSDKVMSLAKTILKPKILERVHLCKDTSIIHEVFTKEMLPEDYGGDELSLEDLQDLVKWKMEQYMDRFDELDRLRVNESLRLENLRNDDYLGYHGNFKKLEVD